MLTLAEHLQDAGSSQQCYYSHFVDENTEAREIKYVPAPLQGYTASKWGLIQVYQNAEPVTNKAFRVRVLGCKCVCPCGSVHENLCLCGYENICLCVGGCIL